MLRSKSHTPLHFLRTAQMFIKLQRKEGTVKQVNINRKIAINDNYVNPGAGPHSNLNATNVKHDDINSLLVLLLS